MCSALGQKEVNPLHSPSNAALGIQASLSGFGNRNTEKKRRKKPGGSLKPDALREYLWNLISEYHVGVQEQVVRHRYCLQSA